MKLLKLIAVLLDYPAEELWAHGDELRAAIDDPALQAALASGDAALAEEAAKAAAKLGLGEAAGGAAEDAAKTAAAAVKVLL